MLEVSFWHFVVQGQHESVRVAIYGVLQELCSAFRSEDLYDQLHSKVAAAPVSEYNLALLRVCSGSIGADQCDDCTGILCAQNRDAKRAWGWV
jgi:hypothetical protein